MEKHWLLNQFDLIMDIINHIKSYTIFINAANLKNIITIPLLLDNFIYNNTMILVLNGVIGNVSFNYINFNNKTQPVFIDFVKSNINRKYIKLYRYDSIEYCVNSFKYQKVNDLTIDGFYYIYGDVLMYY